MHHKRCRPRNKRAGCKWCKPWKVNGASEKQLDTQTRRQNDADKHGDDND